LPPLFVTDAAATEGNELHPYYLPFACNWLQVHENSMDPIHSVFLHTLVSDVAFSESFGVVPVTRYQQTELGVISTTTRRVRDFVWVRVNDDLTPNIAQFGPPWEDGSTPKLFAPAAITRWVVATDDISCVTIGWRHFNAVVDPERRGRREEIGLRKGQLLRTDARPPPRRQTALAGRLRRPGLAASDRRPRPIRRNLQRRISALQRQEPVNSLPIDGEGVLNKYAHDTVLHLPPRNDDDDAYLAQVGRPSPKSPSTTWSEPTATRRQAALDRVRRLGLC